MSEKTEQPTVKQLRDARKKGQVVKSEELVSGAQLVTLFGYFYFQGSALIKSLKALILATLDVLNQPLTQATTHIQDLFLQIVMQFMGGVALLVIVTTVLATIVQTKPLLAWEALEFKLDKLNPMANIKQLVSMKSLFEFLKSVCKVALLSLIFLFAAPLSWFLAIFTAMRHSLWRGCDNTTFSLDVVIIDGFLSCVSNC